MAIEHTEASARNLEEGVLVTGKLGQNSRWWKILDASHPTTQITQIQRPHQEANKAIFSPPMVNVNFAYAKI